MANARLEVASITVTWNGIGTITRHLKALQAQTIALTEIVVVDNNSTDGTRDLLRRDFPDITILPLEQNLGVGGGFAAGLEYALRKGYEWGWLFDQDSVAEPSALEALLHVLDAFSTDRDIIGILAPLLVDSGSGREYVGELWRHRFIKPPPEEAQSPVLFVDSVLSSGSLIRREAIRKAGLPRADFFMDWVDHEYNLRIRNHGFKIAQVRASIISHTVGEAQHATSFFTRKPVIRLVESPWRRYFMTRNETLVCWYLYGTPRSRLLLVLRLVRSMASNLWHEGSRVENTHAVLRGFWDGLRRDLRRRGPPAAVKV